ncbi:DUF4190 domain-containing protein [Streptomyces sp. CMB-StM0423]|uniref:DUF4190 domain-containing protein n=1 Tax=Streptomyces sp. CMB-StM0423 TaxID=2059884 RepID=UPI000C7064A1|nr:DUF4190 domain-containing protein [Streptomyces sp. CMB-StM0423]AUH40200.1 hypothetical protein CXR04_08035 [Streptomyces sp. CMB-StM0423]
METDRRDDAAGRGALRVEGGRETGDPAGEPAGSESGGGAEAGGDADTRAAAGAEVSAGDGAGAHQGAGVTGGPVAGPADSAAGGHKDLPALPGSDLLPSPDGGPPVPLAPDWQRPQPGPDPGPYGPKPYLPGPYAWVPPPGLRNGSGIAALILGVIGAVLSFTLLLSPLAVILGGLAVGFGIVTLRRVRRGEARNRGSGLSGIWLGGVAAVVGIGMSILLVVLAVDFFAPVSPETDSAVEAGETIAYDDGLEVTLHAEAARGGYLDVWVRVENRTGELATLANSEVTAYPIGSDGGNLEQESGSGLPLTLADDRAVVATYRFVLDEGPGEVEFEVSPGGPYEYAYWWKDLDGRTDERPA